MSYVLEVEHIRKAYSGHLAVEDVSFAVKPGRIFGLLGPNGAGKTTSLRMIMDIIAPDSGSIRLFGRPRDEETNERIGYLPEERGLYRKMTVFDHLVFLAEIRGLRKREAVPEIERWLDEVDLREWRDHKVEELSKGMQQKIQYVGTVIHEPDAHHPRRTLQRPRPGQSQSAQRHHDPRPRAGEGDHLLHPRVGEQYVLLERLSFRCMSGLCLGIPGAPFMVRAHPSAAWLGAGTRLSDDGSHPDDLERRHIRRGPTQRSARLGFHQHADERG